MHRTRRELFTDVGKGMLTATLGTGLALDLGLGTVRADEAPERLNFGKLEPLVDLLQQTPANTLQPMLIEKLRGGLALRELVAGAALANARTFGGEDYVGFHTLMALTPAFQMSSELSEERRALPVLKVLYRNATRIQEKGGRKDEVLRPVKPDETATDPLTLRDAIRAKKDVATAERIYAGLARGSADEALNNLLPTVHDAAHVHRIVLVSRAWSLVDLVGPQQAHTMLRQSVRFCVNDEKHSGRFDPLRKLVPALLDQYKLAGKQPGTRTADDAWVDKLSQTIFTGTAAQAAEAVAAALAEGFSLAAVTEGITLATNQLILRDAGRPKQEAPNKPAGSIHGDSIGVHACDSSNAWRNLARSANARNAIVSLIVAGYQAAYDRTERGGDFLKWEPRPLAEAREKVTSKDPAVLLKDVDGAIREKNQALACAIVHQYGQMGGDARAMFDVLLRYAVSEDGALHAEKFYRTTSEEFTLTRAAFRWRQVVALARVTASEYGQPAPGYAEACQLLKV